MTLINPTIAIMKGNIKIANVINKYPNGNTDIPINETVIKYTKLNFFHY